MLAKGAKAPEPSGGSTVEKVVDEEALANAKAEHEEEVRALEEALVSTR